MYVNTTAITREEYYEEKHDFMRNIEKTPRRCRRCNCFVDFNCAYGKNDECKYDKKVWLR